MWYYKRPAASDDSVSKELSRINAERKYKRWREKTPSSSKFHNIFEDQMWSYVSGNWSRRSSCGGYRLVILKDKVRIYEYRNVKK